MSFSSETKNEICTLECEDMCCIKAELSSLFHMCGSIHFEGSKKISFQMRTENAAIARRAFKLLKTAYNKNAKVIVSKNRQFKNRNIYRVIIPSQEDTLSILIDLYILKMDREMIVLDYSIPKQYTKKPCCRKAVIRGAFLGGGSISNPEKAYHLEFTSHSKEYAKQIMNLINQYDLKAKYIRRKNNYVVYIKEGDEIVTMLNIIGAHQTLLHLENIRILKEMKNNVNRLVNCETANLSKTIDAAYRQIEAIEYIDKKIGLNKLPQKLREVAELRLNHGDASLKELGMMLDPSVGKSGINHRLKKIEEIAHNHGLKG